MNDLQVDPHNAQTAYAVVNTFNGTSGQVFKTTNGGVNWTNITGNLPAKPVWSLQIGSTSGTYYVGADDGVYATTSGGSTWTRFGGGLPYAQVFQIELNPRLGILGAATHGRGMWEILVRKKFSPGALFLLLP
ncbi:MAG: WD40/YVTN/BNR-like repeat-containing protein [Desulfobaccales bacterium]